LCLPGAAQRVISLSPHATELLYAAGAGQQVVGVMSGSDYPEEAKSKPLVGDYQSISLETIVSLKPDLVVAWPSGNSIGIADQLKRFGIPVYFSDPESIADIAHDIQALGRLTGHAALASGRAKEVLNQHTTLAEKYSGRSSVKTLMLISDVPMMGLSNSHAVVEAFETSMQPQLIVTTYEVSDPNLWLVRNGFSTFPRPSQAGINPDLMLRQTPRMLDGIEQFCQRVDLARQVRP